MVLLRVSIYNYLKMYQNEGKNERMVTVVGRGLHCRTGRADVS